MPRILVSYGRDEKLAPYVTALTACGVSADDIVRLSPGLQDGKSSAQWLADVDGLLLSGGADVEPQRYGETPAPGIELDSPSPERDELEFGLFAAARERRMPVLAICRGLQLANVALGGSLWQDLTVQGGISGHDCGSDRGFPRDYLAHPVDAVDPVDEAHPAARWLATHRALPVNSRHHQAIRRQSDELATFAAAPDGIVEGIVSRDPDWWLWGVQWHPENLVGQAAHRELFTHFLTASEEAR